MLLLTTPDALIKSFQTNICVYNNSFAMACANAERASHGPGKSAFNFLMTIHGRIYHYIEA